VQNINNNAAASKVLFPTAGHTFGRLLRAIADDTPPALKQARAELEGLEAAGKELDQLLEAEALYVQIQAKRQENQQKIELVRTATNPTVIAHARERGWLPPSLPSRAVQPLSNVAARIIDTNPSITDGYMDHEKKSW